MPVDNRVAHTPKTPPLPKNRFSGTAHQFIFKRSSKPFLNEFQKNKTTFHLQKEKSKQKNKDRSEKSKSARNSNSKVKPFFGKRSSSSTRIDISYTSKNLRIRNVSKKKIRKMSATPANFDSPREHKQNVCENSVKSCQILKNFDFKEMLASAQKRNVYYCSEENITVKIESRNENMEMDDGHQNILRILGKTTVEGEEKLIVQHHSHSLAHYLKEFGNFPEESISKMVKQILFALSTYVRFGHNRLNLQNIYLLSDGVVKIDGTAAEMKPVPKEEIQKNFLFYHIEEILGKASEFNDVWAVGMITSLLLYGNVKQALQHHPCSNLKYQIDKSVYPQFNEWASGGKRLDLNIKKGILKEEPSLEIVSFIEYCLNPRGCMGIEQLMRHPFILAQ